LKEQSILDSRKALLDNIDRLKNMYPANSPRHKELQNLLDELNKYSKIDSKTFNNKVDKLILSDTKIK
jgi:hypothetical protein